MIKGLFGKSKYVTVKRSEKDKIEHKKQQKDDRLWTRCPGCNELIYNKKLTENMMVCPKCSHHFRLTARKRMEITVDKGSLTEFTAGIHTKNILDFPEYEEKYEKAKKETGLEEAVIVGKAAIDSYPVIIVVMDFYFMGGSMGSVVGEKITLAMEKSLETGIPLIIFSTAGGARMQEGMFSLMQMAKTSAAVKKLDEARILFISVMTDPTSGGVTASFASLGDIIIAEPGALIAFAGPRVIKQTISTQLPEGFQRAEFLLEHGMIDMVVNRMEMRDKLSRILKFHAVEVS